MGKFYYGQDNKYHCIDVKFLECDNSCDKVGEHPCSKKNTEAFCGGMSCLQVPQTKKHVVCVCVHRNIKASQGHKCCLRKWT